jgi:cysteinyl-tRNA synthetase
VELLLELRAKVREQKMWDLSDLIRDRLAELGVQVEDGKGGSSWTWK